MMSKITEKKYLPPEIKKHLPPVRPKLDQS